MFRLFLANKIKAGRSKKKSTPRRNRRAYQRYNVDYKHLTVMNDQDILMIRDISAKGFSTQISPRSFERFNIGDVYSAKIRYLGEIYDLEVRVSWKSTKEYVGFEIVNASPEIMEFMQRLLTPVKLGNSLNKVEAAFMQNQKGKSWYHGDNNTDLYVWTNDDGNLSAWQLITDNRYMEWQENQGLSTGQIQFDNLSVSGIIDTTEKAHKQIKDSSLDGATKQLVTDIIMAAELPEQEQLLNTVFEP